MMMTLASIPIAILTSVPTSVSTAPDIFDLIFVITAVIFIVMTTAIILLAAKATPRTMQTLGLAWLGLILPLGVVFVRYASTGKSAATLLCLGGVFLYMLVEFLLDYVFRVDFRRRWITHAPYILLEYVALFGLVYIAFTISPVSGRIVAVPFWILMAGVIYLYARKRMMRT